MPDGDPRRLVGEELRQAQRVAADHDALLELMVGGRDLTQLGKLFVEPDYLLVIHVMPYHFRRRTP